jgi:NAD(P)-dependent dehydrogenase (short-subunit alcohol dehydrogenase family)
MSLLLQGRRCLVTGGGTGIGAGIAQALAGQGARVAVLGRRKAPLAGVVASLGGAKAGMLAVAGDVTRPQSMARACASVRKAFGGLDIVVANAGVGGPNRCAVPGPDRWDAIVRTNPSPPPAAFPPRSAATRSKKARSRPARSTMPGRSNFTTTSRGAPPCPSGGSSVTASEQSESRHAPRALPASRIAASSAWPVGSPVASRSLACSVTTVRPW